MLGRRLIRDASAAGTAWVLNIVFDMDSLNSVPLLVVLRSYMAEFFTFKGYISLLEVFFLCIVLYFALTRAYLPRKSRDASNCGIALDDPKIEEKIAAWKPAPLAGEHLDDNQDSGEGDAVDRVVLTSAAGPVTTVQGIELDEVVNMSSFNFLGLVGNERIEEECSRTMKKYGCGACGPRGFYGTTEVHLQCEAAIAKLMNVEEAILYSYGSSTNASVVPAFCRRGDVIVCDKSISFPTQAGISLSRASPHWFEHNDMEDLERVLKEVTRSDKNNPSKALQQRRFIVVEGISAYHGDLAPLDRIVALKEKYNFRLLLDESFSLGILGKSGLGALEHFSVDRGDVEIATADLGNAFASVGGMCVGEREVVSLQRLSGAGYCFSASQPPFLAAAVTEAIKILEHSGASLVEQLRKNTAFFRDALSIPSMRDAGWKVEGDYNSPLLHVRRFKDDMTRADFLKIRQTCLAKGLLVAVPNYVKAEAFERQPSLRLAVSAAHSTAHLERAARVLAESIGV